MQQPTGPVLKLPDLVSLTPFHWDGCNSHYSSLARESTEWMLGFGLLQDGDRERLISTNPDLLGAYTNPHANAKNLRFASDVMTILYTIDAVTDAQDEEGADATRDIFVKAMTDNSGNDNSPITLFIKDFLRRFPEVSGELRERFVKHFIEYIDSMPEEARLRTDGRIPDSDEYFQFRRKNGGVYVVFDVVEAALGITFPGEVLVDNDFQTIIEAANDMICLANDVYSYAYEHEHGNDMANMVAVLMHHDGLSHQEATDRVAEIYKRRADILIASKAALRSFGQKVDEMVHTYVDGLEQWIAGHNAFNLVTRRCLGEGGSTKNKQDLYREK